jgi:hypothetical protein
VARALTFQQAAEAYNSAWWRMENAKPADRWTSALRTECLSDGGEEEYLWPH